MEKCMYSLQDKLFSVLNEIDTQGELQEKSIELGKAASGFLKNLLTIEAMENSYDDSEDTESYRSYGGYNRGGASYARGNQRRNARGQFSRGNMNVPHRGGHTDKGQILDEMEDMMANTQDQTVRDAIQRAIQHIEG